jgi:hypothetical protein
MDLLIRVCRTECGGEGLVLMVTGARIRVAIERILRV